MNVIAKSANIAPFARATTNVVANGSRPVLGMSKATKPKVEVPQRPSRIVSWSLSQDLSRGAIRVSSGPAGSFDISQLYRKTIDDARLLFRSTTQFVFLLFLCWLCNGYREKCIPR